MWMSSGRTSRFGAPRAPVESETVMTCPFTRRVVVARAGEVFPHLVGSTFVGGELTRFTLSLDSGERSFPTCSGRDARLKTRNFFLQLINQSFE
jgi:hypothetical protein